jgi:hypothetical protein
MAENCGSGACIVIPKYKERMTKGEEVSLRRCSSVLRNYRKVFISPNGLNNEDVMHQYNIDDTLYFDEHFFNGVEGYNRLMLSRLFYERFREYSFVLIHQLDAFIFKDELQFWCDKGYDYIGAPWLTRRAPYRRQFDDYLALGKAGYWPRGLRRVIFPKRKVGNGGLSLRRVSKFCEVLTKLHGVAERFPFQEDLFWSIVVPDYFPFNYRKPFARTAALFSVEEDPRLASKITGNKVPFGCHAWEKIDIDYWRDLFAEVGVVI